jgi:endonuclease/exonuclease/phosphatase family metal-dependent hydrolase
MLYNEILNEIWSISEQFPDHTCLLSDDFNVDLTKNNYCSDSLKTFPSLHNLLKCYDLFKDCKCFTYVNESLGLSSTLDYFFVSDPGNFVDFSVAELANNFSDHLPMNYRLRLFTELSHCQADRNRADNTIFT